MTFMEAIAREEGFDVKGTRPQRNNNPGDIIFGEFAKRHGATHAEPKGKFAVFPTAAAGFAAMRALLSIPATFTEDERGRKHLAHGYLGATVGQALNKWAPPSDGNDTSAYTANVCKWVGCTPDTPIASLL